MEELFHDMAEKGIDKVIVPAISLESNESMHEVLKPYKETPIDVQAGVFADVHQDAIQIF